MSQFLKNFMNNKIITGLLGVFILISLGLHVFFINKVPPCLNADEAAYGYNSYSILKTGRDEYGALLPTRLKSFEDYKLPLYTYFSIPFIGVMGLNEISTRALNILIGVLFVPLIFFLMKELFQNIKTALIASFLTSISTWIHIMSRQAQEGVLCAFFILLGTYFFVKYLKHFQLNNLLLTNLCILLSTFSYHFGRIFLMFFIVMELFVFFINWKKIDKRQIIQGILSIVLIVIIPFGIDIKYSVNRVANLVFYKNNGFHLRIQEFLVEHRMDLFHNEVFEAVRDVTTRYIGQISPDFLVVWGDKTWRFGYKYIGLITFTEYIFIFIGLYYLFHNKEKFRFLILALFLVSPMGNALTWQEYSLIRTYFMFFPLVICIAYGTYHLFCDIKKPLFKSAVIFGVIGLFIFQLVNNWDMYFLHYPKRIEIIRAWQCGYKEMAEYINQNYHRFDRFVITEKYGQPYIFVLFYSQYDPRKYQTQAKISAPDKFGFGQIDKFDKYLFKFSIDPNAKKTAYIGYPEEFKDMKIDKSKLKKIQIQSEEIFWIYEVD